MIMKIWVRDDVYIYSNGADGSDDRREMVRQDRQDLGGYHVIAKISNHLCGIEAISSSNSVFVSCCSPVLLPGDCESLESIPCELVRSKHYYLPTFFVHLSLNSQTTYTSSLSCPSTPFDSTALINILLKLEELRAN